MTVGRAPLPAADEWAARLDLARKGGEWCGPCPVCGGTDRFHVRSGSAGARVGCRGCIDGELPHVRGERFGRVLRAAFPERFEEHDCVRAHESRPESFPRSRPHYAQPWKNRASATVAADSRPDGASCTDPDPRAVIASTVWARSVPADDHLGRVYLSRRLAWPPAGIGPDLPATVLWLDAKAAPDRDPEAKLYGMPDGAIGALVFAWRHPGNADPDPRAVSLLAVSEAGERLTWFGELARKVYMLGARGGLAFEARSAPKSAVSTGFPVHVAEGEADALALSLAPWHGPGAVYSAGGTPGLRNDPERFAALGSSPVVIHADDGARGGGAAGYAQARIQASGWECRVEGYAGDPAEALAEWIAARAAIREYEGGEVREAADRGAWQELMRGNET